MQNIAVPVLVVGGGPVGLSTSLFLARHGIVSLLVERHRSTSIHPRARGINVRTMELFQHLGLEEAVRAAGAPLANNDLFLIVDTLAGTEYRRTPAQAFRLIGERLNELSPTSACVCAQDDLEPILADASRKLGCELRYGTELVAFEQDDSGITAHLRERATGDEYQVRARYMVAADGAGGLTRQTLHVGTIGRGTLGHYINIYFRADLSTLVQNRHFILCVVKHPEVQGVLLAVNNTDRWLINVPYAPEDGATVEDFTPEHCRELIRKAVGLSDLPVEILGVLPWEAAVRVAESFDSNRVFLAGDSAHVMPPTGAFGMNTGIHDAHNLAWKLALVLNGQADPSLLATYDAERRPVAHFTTEQAGLRMDNNTYSGGRGRGGGMVSDLAIILGYSYRSAAIISDEQPISSADTLDLSGRPGTRAPHVWLEQQGKRISTINLFDTRFVLLTGEDGSTWCEAAREVAATLGLQLDTYRVGSTGNLVDLEGNFPRAYNISASGAVLVRPDGFVGWRTKRLEGDARETLEQALRHLLCRASNSL